MGMRKSRVQEFCSYREGVLCQLGIVEQLSSEMMDIRDYIELSLADSISEQTPLSVVDNLAYEVKQFRAVRLCRHHAIVELELRRDAYAEKLRKQEESEHEI